MKICFFILTFLIVNHSFAEPKKGKGKKVKKTTQSDQLRYKNGDGFDVSEKKILKNFDRECTSKVNSKQRKAKQLIPIYRTFPQKLRWKVIEKNMTTICPRNLVQILELEKNEKTPDFARRYLRRYKGMAGWPSQFSNESGFFATQLGKSCQKGDELALKELYCAFSKQSPGDKWLERMKANFRKNCQQYELNFKCQ